MIEYCNYTHCNKLLYNDEFAPYCSLECLIKEHYGKDFSFEGLQADIEDLEEENKNLRELNDTQLEDITNLREQLTELKDRVEKANDIIFDILEDYS